MTSPPLDYISPAELRERAESYRMGGPSSEHTAKMLDDAANRIDALLADNARMREVLEEREASRSQPGSDAQEHSPVPPLSDGGAA